MNAGLYIWLCCINCYWAQVNRDLSLGYAARAKGVLMNRFARIRTGSLDTNALASRVPVHIAVSSGRSSKRPQPLPAPASFSTDRDT